MSKSIYLINPREDAPSYFGFEVAAASGYAPRALIADLATTTVAALVPRTWSIRLVDERVMPVDLTADADVIAITGKVSQRNRMLQLADHFRRAGKLVMIGGPYASLNPDDVQPHCDILVRGEVEEIAAELFSAIEAGAWEAEYEGRKADLARSPVPRWDLYPRALALSGAIQTSRGCPFDCEFCDVIQYVGRKQRHKPIEAILAELQTLHLEGYRSVFLADDNFTVFRRRAKTVLRALADWNARQGASPVTFTTQISIDACRDDELLDLCRQARLRTVFVGIETPNQASLAETHKRQNLGVDLVAAVERFLHHGISVIGGIIVGFDSDGRDIFDVQRRFIERLPVPIVTIGTLVAPAQTHLYARLSAENRLSGHSQLGAGDVFQTNVLPKRMSQKELVEGTERLCRSVYSPQAFAWRVDRFIRTYRSCSPADCPPAPLRLGGVYAAVVARLVRLGAEERSVCEQVLGSLRSQPKEVRASVLLSLLTYSQIRYFLDRRPAVDPVAA
jgi:radical SAM superfamily enzyme YgiQ (UPF0313 family)